MLTALKTLLIGVILSILGAIWAYTQGGGNTAIDPSAVAGLTLWLDANKASTMNSGSPSDGDSVATWNDRSINGFNLSTAGATPPIYKTGIINSKPIVRFNGATTTWLGSSSAISNIVTTTAYTVWVVLQSSFVALDNGCSGANSFITDTVWRDHDSWLGMYLKSTGPEVVLETYPNPACDTFTLSTPFMVKMRLDSGNEFLQINQNTEVSTAAGPVGNVTLPFFLGAGDTAGTRPATVDIAEILFYNVVVSSSDRTNIDNYLKQKWGI